MHIRVSGGAEPFVWTGQNPEGSGDEDQRSEGGQGTVSQSIFDVFSLNHSLDTQNRAMFLFCPVSLEEAPKRVFFLSWLEPKYLVIWN